ncbi:uncharacterized protein [Cicer arietinum]|uniref:Telomeric repeat-binding factor 2-like isoform X2 n=1 Tax=Cicer arietinum TaxID=3827 RepID=A0A1S2XJX4_CICAR|nr:telomeric repeat-binding factor 2-like isoform X2 [Cicer arietinum]
MERKYSFYKTLKETMKRKQQSKNQNNKLSFTEEDSLFLLEKYDASTVLKLLQEIANHAHWKINWNELVNKSSTGISSAKEYRILWRHLAYGYPLIDDYFENQYSSPMDDDSDLECERETLPAIPQQTALQASACVEAMIASVSMSQSTPTSLTIEAPLTINVPTHASFSTTYSQPYYIQEKNINFPVIVERQPRSNIINVPSTTKDLQENELVNHNTPIQKKRKIWSEEEDMQLQAAVQKWGEGNWAQIAGRDDFPVDRNAAQLSKRWRILRNKAGNTN